MERDLDRRTSKTREKSFNQSINPALSGHHEDKWSERCCRAVKCRHVKRAKSQVLMDKILERGIRDDGRAEFNLIRLNRRSEEVLN